MPEGGVGAARVAVERLRADVILATALASLVASYAYLAAGAAWPRTPPGGLGATVLGCVALAAASAAIHRATRRFGADGARGRRAALALALVLHAGFIGVAVAGFLGTGVIPEASAYGSIVLG